MKLRRLNPTGADSKALRSEFFLLFALLWPIALAQVGANAMALIDTTIICHVSVAAMAINRALCRVSGSVVAVESNEIRGAKRLQNVL